MRKEITIAIFLGLGIGLLAVFGIFTARSALTRYEQEKQKTRAVVDAISPTPGMSDTTSPATFTLTVTEPADATDASVASEDVIAVAGKAPGAQAVVITGETEQFIVDTNSDGTFRQEIELVSGENEIRLVAFFQGGERQDKRITVIYTTADF